MDFEKVELDEAEDSSKAKGGAAADTTVEQIVSDATAVLIQLKLTQEKLDVLTIAFGSLVGKFAKLPFEDSEVVRILVDKAINEPLSSSISISTYARLISEICKNSSEETYRKMLREKIMNQCREEFQKRSTDKADIKEIEIAIKETIDGSKKGKEIEEKRAQMERRILGNVNFIGELYILSTLKTKLLQASFMVEVITMLLSSFDELNLKCLCKLLTTVGLKLEKHLKGKIYSNEAKRKKGEGEEIKFEPDPEWFDETFKKLYEWSKEKSLSAHVRFALLGLLELRQNNWKTRLDANAAKTIDEVRRGAIRQEPEEKRQINSLPMSTAQPQFRGDIKKPSDWNTVPSNKSSRFQQKQSGNQHSGSLFLGPSTAWGSRPSPITQLQMLSQSQPPIGKLPPQPTLPPRYGVSRFEAFSDEKKAPPTTPTTRAEIFKSLPVPQSNKNAQQIVSSMNDNDKYEPRDKEPREIVKNIFAEYCFSKNLAETIEWIKEKFRGASINQFIEILSRQIAEDSKEEKQIAAGILINSLISNKVVSKESVVKILEEGVLSDLPDIEVDAPKAVSYLAVFLVEIFHDEKHLLWLLSLGTSLQEENMETWTNLVVAILNILKDKLGKETALQYSNEISNLTTGDSEWLEKNGTQEVNEDLVNKIILAIDENPNDILTPLKELNISDDKYSNLIKAIVVSSWDSKKKLWDNRKLTILLHQLYEFTNNPDAKLELDIWKKFRDYMQQNKIDGENENELWSLWNQQLVKKSSSEEKI